MELSSTLELVVPVLVELRFALLILVSLSAFAAFLYGSCFDKVGATSSSSASASSRAKLSWFLDRLFLTLASIRYILFVAVFALLVYLLYFLLFSRSSFVVGKKTNKQKSSVLSGSTVLRPLLRVLVALRYILLFKLVLLVCYSAFLLVVFPEALF
jgi:hypothetical protein